MCHMCVCDFVQAEDEMKKSRPKGTLIDGQQMSEVFRSVDGVLMLCQYDSELLCK